MKKILLLLISILLLSCNARTVDKKHTEEEIKKKEIVEKTDSTKVKEITTVNSDILKKLSDIGLEIQSDGKPFTLDLGGIKYEGSSTIIYNNKLSEQAEKIIKTVIRDSVVVTYVNEIKEEEFKRVEDEKHSDKKEYQPYALVFGLLILFSILSYILIQRFKSRSLW